MNPARSGNPKNLSPKDANFFVNSEVVDYKIFKANMVNTVIECLDISFYHAPLMGQVSSLWEGNVQFLVYIRRMEKPLNLKIDIRIDEKKWKKIGREGVLYYSISGIF